MISLSSSAFYLLPSTFYLLPSIFHLLLLQRLALVFLFLGSLMFLLAVCGAKASHHRRGKTREPVKSRFSKKENKIHRVKSFAPVLCTRKTQLSNASRILTLDFSLMISLSSSALYLLPSIFYLLSSIFFSFSVLLLFFSSWGASDSE